MHAAGTIGTGPPAVAKPCPRSARYRITPSAADNPKADPPARTIASTRSTVREGSSRSVSRVAGAPPRTSPEPTEPEENSITVTPVPIPVTWPMRTPATPKLDTGGIVAHRPVVASRSRSGRFAAHFAGELDDQPVELVGPLEHQHVPAVAQQLEPGVGNEAGNPPGLERRGEDVGRPPDDQRGDADVREVSGEVETH